jgi:phosphoglycolate phosphatase
VKELRKYDVILFHLDGTLTDPGIGITNSVMHALKKYGIEVEDRKSLYKFIGPPLIDSFEKYFDF